MRTSDLFLELNTTKVSDEQFDEYFFNKRDLGKVFRELIRLLTVPKIMLVLDNKLNEALEIAKNNKDNVLSWVNLHGVFTAIEQVTRIVDIEHSHLIKNALQIAWNLPYQEYTGFRLITLDIIENLAYIVGDKGNVLDQNGQSTECSMVEETMEFVKYTIDSLSVPLA